MMVGHPLQDSECAVDLLTSHKPGEIAREGGGGEAPAGLGVFLDFGGQPIGPANHKTEGLDSRVVYPLP